MVIQKFQVLSIRETFISYSSHITEELVNAKNLYSPRKYVDLLQVRVISMPQCRSTSITEGI